MQHNPRQVIIHIGYPKAGSDFLWSYFNSNPAFFVEGNDFNMRYISSGELPAELNRDVPPDKHYVISEEQLSVWGGNIDIVGVRFKQYDIKSHQKKICQRLHAAFPQAKILIVTRGFEKALRSMYWQYISIGGILNFSDFQNEYAAHFSDFYDYDYLIPLYRSFFGKNAIVLPFELLHADSTAFLRAVEARCNLPCFDFAENKMNVSQPEKISSYRFLSLLLYRSIQLLPYSLQKKIYQRYMLLLRMQKLEWAVQLFPPGKPQLHISTATLRLFANKAILLKNEPLYQPFAQEYLFPIQP